MTFTEIIIQSMLSGFSSYFGVKVAIRAEKHIKNNTFKKLKNVAVKYDRSRSK